MTALEHNTSTPSTDLMAPSGGPLVPPTAEAARLAMETYQEISNALLTKDDLQEIRTRKGTSTFPKRSAFQKLANAYRVSTEIITQTIEYSDDGEIVRCNVVVRATHPDGRYSEGDGACSASEDRFAKNREKIDHDLPATAVTRAKNRAISDLVAFGAVSAEEAEGMSETGARRPEGVPAWAAPVNDVPSVAFNIERVLKVAQVEDPAAATQRVGQAIFDLCDEGFPFALARLANLLANETSLAEVAPVDADGIEYRGGDQGAGTPPPVDAEATSEPETSETTNDEGNAA